MDITTLLQPISTEHKAGEDIRADASPESLYYKVKDARYMARDIERKNQMEYDNADVSPYWQTVYDDAVAILQNKAKDVEVASWLVEALIRRQGMAGLGQGLQVLHELLQNYWDDIHPLPDEDGLEMRFAPLIGLNGEDAEGTLLQPIRELPITQGSSEGPFALWQYKQAIELETVTDDKARKRRLEDGALSLDTIRIALEESTPEFYQELQAKIQTCQQQLQAINELLNEKAGREAPSVTQIRTALEDFSDHIRFILKEASFGAMVFSDEELVVETEATPAAATTSANANGEINSRQQALTVLKNVANFFKRTEPQSPIPYLLERAVRWGGLSLPELLNELIQDNAVRDNAFTLTGISDPSSEDAKK